MPKSEIFSELNNALRIFGDAVELHKPMLMPKASSSSRRRRGCLSNGRLVWIKPVLFAILSRRQQPWMRKEIDARGFAVASFGRIPNAPLQAGE